MICDYCLEYNNTFILSLLCLEHIQDENTPHCLWRLNVKVIVEYELRGEGSLA